MEPGEYLTNVLSISNFSSIYYDYFELQNPSLGGARDHLQKVEASWREEGVLVHCDPVRDRIWCFQKITATAGPAVQRPAIPSPSNIVEVHGIFLVRGDKGIYEPANLVRGKYNTANNISTSSSSSSPSSSLDNAVRNGQAVTPRAVQAIATQSIHHDPSLGTKLAIGTSESSPTSLKEIHEFFISAVLGSIVYFLCRDHGFVPLNARTLIVKSPNGAGPLDATIMLATLDISLTSLGTVVVKAHSDPAPGLRSLADSANSALLSGNSLNGTTLWLAPGGNAARFYGTLDDHHLPGSLTLSHLQTSLAEQLRPRASNVTVEWWKSSCIKWLSAKGLNPTALESGGWVLVRIFRGRSQSPGSDNEGISMLEDLTIVLWPAALCFQTSRKGSYDLHSTIMDIPGSRDPLSFAEEWFTSKDDRAKIMLKRQKEREKAEASSREQAEVESRGLNSNTFSPVALRRGSNAGAMYPTPPDAIHHPVGATPSFDGAASTPGNPNQLFTHESEPAAANVVVAEADTGIWSSSDRRESNNPTVHFNENENDGSNLFADIGGDLFGDTDITDADFSFFDEPDVVPVEQASDATAAVVDPNTRQSSPSQPIDQDAIIVDRIEAPNTDMTDSSHTPKPESHLDDALFGSKVPTNHELVNTGEESSTFVKAPHTFFTPPFNKETVFKRLFQGSSGPKRSAHPHHLSNKVPRRQSVFEKVDFKTSLLSVNEKYGLNGRFDYMSGSEIKPVQLSQSIDLPKTEYLNRRRKSQDDEQRTQRSAHILKKGVHGRGEDKKQDSDDVVSSDATSNLSEQDDPSPTTEKSSLLLTPGVKRKRQDKNAEGVEIVSTLKGLAVEYDQSVGTPRLTNGFPLPLLEADAAEWSLAAYITSQELDEQSNVLSDIEYIATAQILADQAVTGSLKFTGASRDNVPPYSDRSSMTRELMHSVAKAVKTCFNDVAGCTMRTFLDIQGIPVLNQALRLPPRPIPNPRGASILDITRPNNIFSLPPPQLEVRRSDSNLSILPSAVNFWENLGLGPSQGSKDVAAICVYPNIEGVAESAHNFLDEMRSVYESCRFGSHERITSNELIDSLLPFDVDAAHVMSKADYFATLKETISRLSRILSYSLSLQQKNIVVYFIYPVDDGDFLVHICSAFQHLFNLYGKALSEKKVAVATELVLQLIPLDFVASSTSFAVTPPSEYSRLAMEVYDRCIDLTTSSSTAAILLERPLPKNIDFKLNANPSASLLQENSCLHIAYAQSIDERWVSAAWTNNRGSQQMTASYCLGRKNEPISMPFPAVVNEIWETTLDIISSKKIHWRIMIARVGIMDSSEIDLWTDLAATVLDAQVNLTLITINTEPSLRLLPPSVKIPPATTTQSVMTPVSTPQAASIVSPENIATPTRDSTANVATPGEPPMEPDSDARLVDFTDQTWGAVASHRLNNSNSLLECNPALISGYLIKRGGVSISDTPLVMEVNIVHCEVAGNPRTFHDGLLREILGYYRGLGTIARARGVVDAVKDGRPWHVAAVEKAVKALYMLM